MFALKGDATMFLFLQMNPSLTLSNSESRKRNPYSIEELLKKPEKKRKIILASSINRETEKKVCETNEETLNVETCD